MRLTHLFGCLCALTLLVGTVQAAEPGSDESPVIQERAAESAPAPAPVYSDGPEAPMPVMDSAGPAIPGQGSCTMTCYRPVWRTQDVTCTRRVCKYREEVRTCKVPIYVPETLTRTITCWRTECETVMQTVTKCVNVPDECGRLCPQIITCEVPVPVARQVPYEVEQQYTVCKMQFEEREYTVQVPYWDTEEFTQQVQYCEMEAYEVEVACCVPTCSPCCSPCAPACGPGLPGVGFGVWF